MLLSPILAETIAGWGWSKRDVQQYLFDHARIPASQFERSCETGTAGRSGTSRFEVKAGTCLNLRRVRDPERLVPLVWAPEHT